MKVIFQPAEEVNRGAALMVATGLLDDVGLFLSGHTYPWYPAGTLGVRPGPVMASADRFFAKIIGKGCHAAFNGWVGCTRFQLLSADAVDFAPVKLLD